MKMCASRWLVIALVVSACQGARAPEPPRIPGQIWLSKTRPWHVAATPIAITPDGATVMLGARNGWVARFDLATGATLRERSIGPGAIHDLVHLRDGRWLAVGAYADRAIAYTLDATTLAATRIEFPSTANPRYSSAEAELLDDGSVVIASTGSPLAIYDTATWTARRVVDAEPGWHFLQVFGTRLYATNAADDVYRFDLATGVREQIGHGRVVGSVGPYARRASNRVVEVVRDGAPTPSVIPMTASWWTLDPSGVRIAAVDGGVLEIRDAMTGAVAARHKLGVGASIAQVVFAGDRAIIVADAIQTIDLATGARSPDAEPPFGATRLAVGNDGSMLAKGDAVWRIEHGAITAMAPLDHSAAEGPPGDTLHYATYDRVTYRGHPIVALYAVGSRTPTRSWTLEQDIVDAWLAPDGNVAFDGWANQRQPARLLRTDGAKVRAMAPLAQDGHARDIDVDGGRALVGYHGYVYVVDLAIGKPFQYSLVTPHCSINGHAELERGGDRAFTYADGDLYLWQPSTGDRLGSVHFESDIDQALFVRDGELLITTGGSLVAWSPRDRSTRTFTLGSEVVAAVSPDSHFLGLAFPSGQTALVDRAAMLITLDATPATPAPEPTRCALPDATAE